MRLRRCADEVDCGYDNRDSELFCRACGLPLLETSLAGRYVVEALLSKGGYAAVFRGIDQNLSRHIAIKVLLPSKTTPNERDHFLREARIAATLDHPNIAPILDYGKDGSSVFLVMPLYTVGSLRTRLAQVNGPLPIQEVTSNFHQLAHVLYYAHTRQRPIIHRDIKPENILIHQEDYRLMITDFGIARSLEPGTSVGKTITVRGTVGYMAPEQSSGIVDPRSDQYGCAVVLYEMLTGYHPLDPRGGAIPTVTSLNPDLPPLLDTVLQRALAARPEERYADMMEFMRAFDYAYRPNARARNSHSSSVMAEQALALPVRTKAPIKVKFTLVVPIISNLTHSHIKYASMSARAVSARSVAKETNTSSSSSIHRHYRPMKMHCAWINSIFMPGMAKEPRSIINKITAKRLNHISVPPKSNPTMLLSG
jgi:serine/threonine protein kinase